MKMYFDELPVGLRLNRCVPEGDETELSIPEGVTELSDVALRYCPNITHLKLPSTLKLHNGAALTRASGLQHIEAAPDNPYFFSRDGVLFRTEGPNTLCLLRYPAARKDKAYIIPRDVQVVGSYAFTNCTHLEKVLLHEDIWNVGEGAFAMCLALQYVQIDCRQLLYLREYAFRFCSRLEQVNINGKIGRVGEYAFDGCAKLTHITFPAGLTHIGRAAFVRSGLESITLPSTVVHLGMNIFYDCDDLKRIRCTNAVAQLIPEHHDLIMLQYTFN